MPPESNLPVMTGLQVVLGAGSGGLVGFMLGLVGGGGSILAVPLMIYVVRVHDPHVAIGTSPLAVAANAAVGLFHHARRRNVIWRCGGMDASPALSAPWPAQLWVSMLMEPAFYFCSW